MASELTVIGVGNDHAPQDAAGLWLFAALRGRLPGACFVRWVSPRPELALALQGQGGTLAFVDSVAPENAGDGLLLSPWRPGLLVEETPVSSHGFGLSEVLALSGALGASPTVHLVGVPPVDPVPDQWVNAAADYLREVHGA